MSKIFPTFLSNFFKTCKTELYRQKKKWHWRNPFNRIALIYAKGYSCAQYFKDLGVRTISVYCEPRDRLRATQILFDLSLNFDIDIKFLLSGRDYDVSFPDQNLTESLAFRSKFIEQLTENDEVLILSSKRSNSTIAAIYEKTKKIYPLADIWPDMWWRTMIAENFREIRALFPFLPIVIFDQPRQPTNKKNFSETEKYLAQHNRLRLLGNALQVLNAGVPKTYEDFGYTPEELLEMLATNRSYIDGKRMKLVDFNGKKVNIVNGHRIVPGQPTNSKRTVYLFGGCITFGVGCPDDGTSSAYLQGMLNKSFEDEFRVENFGMFLWSRLKYGFENMKSMPFRPGDILICSFVRVPARESAVMKKIHTPPGVFHLDTSNLLERPHAWGENVFFERAHPNECGQFAIASTIFDFLESHNFFSDFIRSAATPMQSMLPEKESEQLHAYLEEIALLHPKIGSIVMNCNPFTLGHRYLVEYAAARCSQLFIFVVEEDKSDFPFADRIELVRSGTADIANVTVLPSGKFIISSLTFVDYFGKSEMQDRTVDPSMDVELFGKHIAPKLGINVRFVGEEPLDNVTRQYNETMQRILPQYGVDFEVIPRKEIDGQVISASRVRKMLETKDFDAIAKLVPETTLAYLKVFVSAGDNSDLK